VNRVLEELGADGKPTIVALNKIDLLQEDGAPAIEELRADLTLPEDVVAVSAARRRGLDDLLAAVEKQLEHEQEFVRVTLEAPYDRSDLVNRFHQIGRVEGSSFDERGTSLTGLLPSAMVASFEPFVTLQASVQKMPAKVAVAPESAA
jgi:GTPase